MQYYTPFLTAKTCEKRIIIIEPTLNNGNTFSLHHKVGLSLIVYAYLSRVEKFNPKMNRLYTIINMFYNRILRRFGASARL